MVPYPYYVPRIHLPEQFVPNDYLLLTVVVLVLSCILNVTALMFSIPALISSIYVSYSILKMVGFSEEEFAVLWIFYVTKKHTHPQKLSHEKFEIGSSTKA